MQNCQCIICDRDNTVIKIGWVSVPLFKGGTAYSVCPICYVKLAGRTIQEYVIQYFGLRTVH